jgi:hypothetical protein
MASTFTSNIRLELQADGENPNSWGSIINQNVIDLVDQAIAAYTTVALSTSDVTLTALNGQTDQSRSPFLELTGTVSSSLNVIIPNNSKSYIINNKCTFENSSQITVKTLTGQGSIVSPDSTILYVCDSVSVFPLTETSGVYAFLSSPNTFTGTNTFTSAVTVNAPFAVSASATFSGQTNLTSTTNISGVTTFNSQVIGALTTLTDATSVAVNFANGNHFLLQLTSAVGASRTLENPSNATIGQVGHIYIIQDVSTGSRTLSFGDSYKFAGGTVPTITTSIGSVDLLVYSVRGVSVVDTLAAQDLKV